MDIFDLETLFIYKQLQFYLDIKGMCGACSGDLFVVYDTMLLHSDVLMKLDPIAILSNMTGTAPYCE